MNQPNQQEITVAGAASVNFDAPPKLFKLNIDCFDKLFDYLSLNDIYAMSETCKVMRQVAGYYFQQNFSDAVGIIGDDWGPANLYMGDSDDYTSYNGFSQFITKLRLDYPIQKILKTELFSSVKCIEMMGDFDIIQLHYIKDILSNVEILDMGTIEMDDNVYEQFTNCCTDKLKYLRVRCNNLRQIEITHDWLQTNPTLERLELRIFNQTPANSIAGYSKVVSLLEQNPNVKHFEIKDKALWEYRNSFAESNIQLNLLIIQIGRFSEQSRQFTDLLIKLNQRGFYKNLQLNVYSREYSQEFINRVASIDGLELMCLRRVNRSVHLSPLVHLKRLCLLRIVDTASMDTLAKNLVNLEKLHVRITNTDAIISFLCHSRKLKVIKVGYLISGGLIGNNTLDLAALNEQRQKLNGARKVWIYVEEKVYLATKWATKNCNFSLVDIKRGESIILELFYTFSNAI